MTPNELKEHLLADNWRIGRNGYSWKRTNVDWWAWKNFEGLVDCRGNDKPPHVALIPWDLSDSERTR